jgi:hypothetical protein
MLTSHYDDFGGLISSGGSGTNRYYQKATPNRVDVRPSGTSDAIDVQRDRRR